MIPKYRIIEVKKGNNEPDYYVEERFLWWYEKMHIIPHFTLEAAKIWLDKQIEKKENDTKKEVITVVWKGSGK